MRNELIKSIESDFYDKNNRYHTQKEVDAEIAKRGGFPDCQAVLLHSHGEINYRTVYGGH